MPRKCSKCGHKVFGAFKDHKDICTELRVLRGRLYHAEIQNEILSRKFAWLERFAQTLARRLEVCDPVFAYFLNGKTLNS